MINLVEPKKKPSNRFWGRDYPARRSPCRIEIGLTVVKVDLPEIPSIPLNTVEPADRVVTVQPVIDPDKPQVRVLLAAKSSDSSKVKVSYDASSNELTLTGQEKGKVTVSLKIKEKTCACQEVTAFNFVGVIEFDKIGKIVTEGPKKNTEVKFENGQLTVEARGIDGGKVAVKGTAKQKFGIGTDPPGAYTGAEVRVEGISTEVKGWYTCFYPVGGFKDIKVWLFAPPPSAWGLLATLPGKTYSVIMVGIPFEFEADGKIGFEVFKVDTINASFNTYVPVFAEGAGSRMSVTIRRWEVKMEKFIISAKP